MEQSILESTKQILGVDGQTDFDTDVLTAINSAFLEVKQIGAGKTGAKLYIEDASTNWLDLFDDNEALGNIKQLVHQSARLAFDPPQTSFGIAAIERQIEKAVWRIQVALDGGVE